MEHGEAGKNRHVHFGVACVKHAAASIEISPADQIGGLSRCIEGGSIAGMLIPERQR